MPNLWAYRPHNKSLPSCSCTKPSWQQPCSRSFSTRLLFQLWRDGSFPKKLPKAC
ncbi:hypothetical protein Hanom_Chr00s154170g01823061 [Helianthus anomalus]